MSRGAQVQPGGGVRFEVWAPSAERVTVHLDPERGGSAHALEPCGSGVFAVTVRDAQPGQDYVFQLDDGAALPDPVSRWQPEGVHGPSRIVDPCGFAWTDGGWSGASMHELVLYEVHVGTFTPQGTFDAVAERLPYLRELGVTAIELMPVGQFPGQRNWGYDGVFAYAPQDSYGGPQGLKHLVDRAHDAGLAVVLDVVYNHLGPEGNVLGRYGPYFTDRYKTPWGAAVNFDGPDSDEVRRYFIDNALYWIMEYHMDGLRLDAVHAIYDFSARHILEELAAAVHEAVADVGRRAVVIAESDLNDPRLVRSRERGGYGLDGVWSDDFHHAVHAALTKERVGYYVDFGGIEPIARAVRDRFALAGRYSAHRRRRHGAPATDVSADRFVVSIQNHDQTGNRARGDRLSTLVSFEERKLAAALMLLSPYVPLLFMGEEYGETNPFLYFVSHTDEKLIEAVRKGRRHEFKSFGWREAIPDPQAEETFRRAVLNPGRAGEGKHGLLVEMYRDLLGLRREQPALEPGTAEVQVEHEEASGWLAWRLTRGGAPELLAVFNLSGQPTRTAIPAGKPWRLLFSTNDRRYGGNGEGRRGYADITSSTGTPQAIPARTALLYVQEVD